PILPLSITPYIFVLSGVLGGYFTFITAGKEILKGKLVIDFLMLFAAVGAAALGRWGEGALLLFLFSLGHALENYAMERARKSIKALTALTVNEALVVRGNIIQEVEVDELIIGDIVVVKPNSKIPVDGVVVKGSRSVDQSPITGESIPVEKFPLPFGEREHDLYQIPPEHQVFAGTINGNEVLEIKTLRKAKDSTVSRLIHLVKEAEEQKSPTQHLADNFEKFYVPIVLTIVFLLMLAPLVLPETFRESFYRAMSVLIAASPCALAISTPSAVLAGISRAARQGILIKGGGPLEDLGSIKAIAFDKTGTLTRGKPQLTHVVPYANVNKTHLLKAAIAVEAMSPHPLARAITVGGKAQLGEEAQHISPAESIVAITARGVKARWQNSIVHIGNRLLFQELTGQAIPGTIDQTLVELESQGNTAMIVHQDDQYLGVIAVMDIARPEAKETLTQLGQAGIKKMVMLTGDNQRVANAVAKEIGLTDAQGDLLPEDKVEAIKQLKIERGKVAMVGDGVNDAPALAQSTVGIAMGAAGSDVALETADIALMGDKLRNLPFAVGLSRKANG
ncbi:MAG: heavy metal translocating P-type ATPase, partial [Bacteroidota bacterium]